MVKCAKCLAVLKDPPDVPVAERRPCAHCGSTARLFEVDIVENIEMHDSMSMKARRGSTGRPFLEAKAGANLHRTSGNWMHRDLVIDRDNDRYVERIVDSKTAAVIHECKEPLSRHRGHGTAKRRRDSK